MVLADREGRARILFTDALTVPHHRRSFRHLVTEYRRAAGGCAKFVKTHRDAPLARKRLGQAILPPLVGLAALASAGLAVVDGHAFAVAAALAAGLAVLMAQEFRQSRTAESLAYPLGAHSGSCSPQVSVRGPSHRRSAK